MTETEALIALNQLPKIGPVKTQRLVSALGSAAQVLSSSSRQLEEISGIGPDSAGIIVDWQSHADPSEEIRLAHERDISILTQADSNYPEKLRQSHDAPVLLYVWGNLETRDDHGIAIVGSRRATHYGKESARKFAFQLANAGVTVTSGLARGIDTCAHEGALAAKGRTIAVIGSGLMQLYPPENLSLAEKIASGHGAVVSEFPLRMPPDKKTFPQRNRIVAHWTEGTLVVECPSRSGSLITANLANEAGRQVYAIPGPIDRPSSGGCHDLIRDGATLVTDGSHILEDFQFLALESSEQKTVIPRPLNISEDENIILDAIGPDEKTVDEIITLTKLPAASISIALMKMELNALVLQLPGQRYRCKTKFSD
ncbi:DNA-processing protein DprA [Akkermansiaceae bacterium]|nr:DNA-processing protein DprA [Akkermansiaceae bacterium]